jgi:hypothetical protein
VNYKYGNITGIVVIIITSFLNEFIGL